MRTKLRTAAGLTVCAIVLAGCGDAPNPSAADPASDDYPVNVELRDDFDPNAEFSYAHSYPPSSFDPLTSASGLDQTYLAPIYDRLIYRTPEGDLEPMLATAWEPSADGMSLTITLQEGLSFTDGTPFDAEAVKTNLDRYLTDQSKLKQEIAMVTGVEVAGSLEVVISVDGGLGPLTAALAGRPGMMVSPTAIAAGTVEAAPVGIGPYTSTEVIPGQSVSLTKTEGYWDPTVQRVGTMRLIGMPEAQTRLNAVTTGQISATSIDPGQIEAAEAKDLDILSGPTPLFYFFALNSSVAPFDDPEVRKAISMSIDREGIGNGLFEGYCKPQVQLWPENSFAYDDDFGSGLESVPYDPDEAKKMLDEAGYTGGESYDAVLTNNTVSVQLAEAVQSNLSEVGVEINVNPVPSGGIIDYFAVNKSMPTAVSGYTGGPDPASVIDRNLTVSAPYNPGENEYPELDEIAAKGANAVDPEERKSAYLEYSEAFVDANTHLIPICMLYGITAYDPKVSNLYSANDFVDLRGVAVDA